MVKLLHASSFFSDTVYAVALKLHTLIQGNKMTLYAKSHNFELNFDWIMPLFGHESWLNLCIQVHFSDTVYAVALKLHTFIQGYKMTLYAKSHNSELNFDWIVPLFGLKHLG